MHNFNTDTVISLRKSSLIKNRECANYSERMKGRNTEKLSNSTLKFSKTIKNSRIPIPNFNK